MPDASELRASDSSANTAAGLAAWAKTSRGIPIDIPNLLTLGLWVIDPAVLEHIPAAPPAGGYAVTSKVRRSALGYPGADSFVGHQTMMGADMTGITWALVREYQDEILRSLQNAGFKAELLGGTQPVVVAEGASTFTTTSKPTRHSTGMCPVGSASSLSKRSKRPLGSLGALHLFLE